VIACVQNRGKRRRWSASIGSNRIRTNFGERKTMAATKKKTKKAPKKRKAPAKRKKATKKKKTAGKKGKRS
jgi:hypothetical protein